MHRIYLVKGQGRNPITDIADFVRDIGLTAHRNDLIAQNHVGVLLIYIQGQTGHARNHKEAVRQLLDLRKFSAIDNQAYHNFAGGEAFPDQHMAQKSLSGILIVRLDVMLIQKIENHFQYSLILPDSQSTVRLRHDAVGASSVSKNLKIKKLLQKPLIKHGDKLWAKKFALKFGTSICCPCVTINTKIVGKKPYKTDLKCDLDWDTWYEFSKINGNFLYINKEIMCHRIHEESETSNLIQNNIRLEEDYEMFKKFWPKGIAKFIMHFYKKAIKTNS